jgi:hypothetical protein
VAQLRSPAFVTPSTSAIRPDVTKAAPQRSQPPAERAVRRVIKHGNDDEARSVKQGHRRAVIALRRGAFLYFDEL